MTIGTADNPLLPGTPTIPVSFVTALQTLVTTAHQIYYSLEMGLLNPAEVERLESLETSVLHTCHRLLAEQITRTGAA
ncbi:hypothetical protein UO65_2977 [Actinokineospora spheciospongiae]|uniref:Uncharacterized protein n=1 Tax=Actinokineospora spheciospongiae TaxID=909613 RepID=W7J6C4_9PSEU|nr:hypothetical protein [Actinokineospora spheciospongiae]EWC61619.1 hypothetical protein UO65_2977 [Actinokineospora spheciospongiae]PWW62315.1 hypothetical protein DFQ13_105125 [Actinokineospora spheciospongiae]